MKIRCFYLKCVFLNYAQEFNKVPRQQILTGLSEIRTPQWIFSWLLNYFQDRKQYTCINRAKSSSVSNNCGMLRKCYHHLCSPFIFHPFKPQIHAVSSNMQMIWQQKAQLTVLRKFWKSSKLYSDTKGLLRNPLK